MHPRLALAAPLAFAVLVFGTGAQARVIAYAAALDGAVVTSHTGSKATGKATMTVDTEKRTVDLTLDVSGIGVGDLYQNLVKAPVGPIHLHVYSGHDHANASAELLLPVPYGEAYKPAARGFTVRVNGYPYATGATLLKSDVPFEAFVAALDRGDVVLNVHTEAFHDGEISGVMVRKG